MTVDDVPSLSSRLEMLFGVWRNRDGVPRSNTEVSADLRAEGIDVNADDVARWREGQEIPDRKALLAIARVFPGDSNVEYLTMNERASSIHSQLALVFELVAGNVRDLRLRRGNADLGRDELTAVLRQLRMQ
jgi:hypothetical protein